MCMVNVLVELGILPHLPFIFHMTEVPSQLLPAGISLLKCERFPKFLVEELVDRCVAIDASSWITIPVPTSLGNQLICFAYHGVDVGSINAREHLGMMTCEQTIRKVVELDCHLPDATGCCALLVYLDFQALFAEPRGSQYRTLKLTTVPYLLSIVKAPKPAPTRRTSSSSIF